VPERVDLGNGTSRVSNLPRPEEEVLERIHGAQDELQHAVLGGLIPETVVVPSVARTDTSTEVVLVGSVVS
jgi:hypothetical protein